MARHWRNPPAAGPRLSAYLRFGCLSSLDLARQGRNNPRLGRPMNMLRQARRFDPSGDYVRRYLQN